jgi:hypothetical protein
MALTPISLGLRSNPGRHEAISAARLINCYAEDVGDQGKIRFPVVAADGFDSFATLAGGSPPRAMLAFSDTVLYLVAGAKLLSVSGSGSVAEIGDNAIAGSGRVTMARNRKTPNAQVAIVVAGQNSFSILENSVRTTVAMPADTAPLVAVAALDGYFLLLLESGEWYVTAIDEGTDIDEIEFAKAESNPDGLVAGAIRGASAVLFGDRSTEFFTNTGTGDFPFSRETAISIGCYAAATVAEIVVPREGGTSDTVAFVATDSKGSYAGVMLLDGYTGAKISSHAVDRAIRKEPDKASLRGFTWTSDGHCFYCLTGSSFTWVYDTATGLWHERQSAGLPRWRIATATTFAGRTIVGDTTLGRLYWMRPDLFDAANPSVLTFRHLNDDGNSWLVTRARPLGTAAAPEKPIKFTRCGQSKANGKVMRFDISNAVMEDGVGVPMTVIPPAVHAWPQPMRFYATHVYALPGVSQNAKAKGIQALAVDAVTLKE